MTERGIGVFENGDGDGEPCPRCWKLSTRTALTEEAIMPLPKYPPLSREVNEPCCYDCQAADTMVALDRTEFLKSFVSERRQVWIFRKRQLCYPNPEEPLAKARIAKPCVPGDDLRHMAWLLKHGLWYGTVECYAEASLQAFYDDPFSSTDTDGQSEEDAELRRRLESLVRACGRRAKRPDPG